MKNNKQYNFNWNIVFYGAPFITLTAEGISLNSIAIEKIGNPNFIIIGFDENKMIIGIKKHSDEKDIHVYSLANRMRDNWIRIGCKEFILYLESLLNCNFKKSRKIMAQFDKKTELLIVQIKV